jgi:threonine dehydrogenase-like Zn-dependent dehydrogenase
MKSLAVTKDLKLEVVEVSMPKHGDNEMLVKTLSCGVCNGTDTKILHGKFKNIDVTEYPCLLGHEAIGEIVKIGKNVVSFEVGDKIMMPFSGAEDEGYSSYWGGYSEYGICSDWKAMANNGEGPGSDNFGDYIYTQSKLPKDIDPADAVMIITFREVLSSAKIFGFEANKSLAVFGAGPVGLSFIKFAKMLGVSPIIVFDIVDEKLEEAKKMGADYTFNSTKVDPAVAVKEICKDGVDFSLDAVGVNALIQKGMELIKDGGAICIYGISPNLSMDLDWSKAPYNWNLKFQQFPVKAAEAAAHEQIMNWIELGVLDPKDFISHVIDFDNVLDAFEIIEKKQPCKKIVIKY